MFCRNCGKEVSNDVFFCPECGEQQPRMTTAPNNGANNFNYQTGGAQTNSYNTLCIVGLVVSVISLFLNLLGIVGIAGIVVSALGLINCEKTKEKGKNLSILGIVIGSLSVLWALAVLTILG